MKIQRAVSLSNLTTFEDLRKWSDFSLDQIFDVLNGKVAFSDNIDANSVTASFSAAATDVQVAHGLNRGPIGYIVIRRSAAITIYDGSAAWTTDNIYIRSSGAGNITLLVF